jgi:hypothetical protein
MIAGWEPAAQGHGGDGAFYVRLRRADGAMTPLGARMRAMREERGVTLKEMAQGAQCFVGLSQRARARAARQADLDPAAAHHRLFQRHLGRGRGLQRLAEVSDPKITIDTAACPGSDGTRQPSRRRHRQARSRRPELPHD